VAFDYRGTGHSLPALEGSSPDNADAVRHVDTHAAASTVRAPFETFSAETAAANDAALIASMGTDTAARDMDVLRVALGEERLDFVGVSYGTWLGAVYATAFPTHVRAFALDGVFPPGDVREIARLEASGYDASLARFFEWCARTTSCTFRSGSTDPAVLAASFDALMTSTRATPIPAGARTLDVADLVTAVTRLLAGRQWGMLGTVLAQAVGGYGNSLLTLADGAWGWDGMHASTLRRARANAILFADHPLPAGLDAAGWDSFVTGEIDTLGPRLGRDVVTFFAASPSWTFRPPPSAPIHAETAPPLLILQGLHDPATPSDGATALQAALANGSYLVTYEGDGHITLLQTSCTRDVLATFLLDPTAAPATTTCPDTAP